MLIAQFNASLLKHPLEHPSTREFRDNLVPINDIARSWPGFVWKLQDESGHSANLRTDENPDMTINLSVWQTVEDLKKFLKYSAHRDIQVKGRQWFHKHTEPYSVLWWISDDDEYPSLEEGWAKLDLLRKHGPSANAFTFKNIFEPTT